MHPILFELGGWPVYSYGVLLAAAYLVALQLAVVRARRRGLDGTRVMDLGIYLIIAALVGAKLMLVVVDFNYFRTQPRELLSLVRAGGVFYGGLIAALVTAIVLARRYQLRIWTTADLFAPGIALGHVVGPSRLPDGGVLLRQADEHAVGHHVHQSARVGQRRHAARHPAAPDADLRGVRRAGSFSALLLATERRGQPFEGRTFWLYMILYGVSRFVIEFFRGDDRGVILGVSTSQFVSIVLVPVAIAMLVALAVSCACVTTPEIHQERLIVSAADAGRRLDVFLATRLPVVVTIPGSATDSGRPRHGRRRSRQVQRNRHCRTGHRRHYSGRDAGEAAGRGPAARQFSTTTRTSSLSTSPRAWSSTRRPDTRSGTLVNALLHHVHGLSGIGGQQRPGIVHRLDRGTSGVMVIAKNDRAHRELSAAISRPRRSSRSTSRSCGARWRRA